MWISPAGIVCIIICIGIIIRRKNVFFNLVILTAVLEIFVGKGFINNLSLYNFTFYIVFIYSFFHLKKITPSIGKNWLYMLCAFIIPIILLILFPSNEWVAAPPDITWDAILYRQASPVHPQINSLVLSRTLKFILFSIVYLYIYMNWKYEDYNKMLSKIAKISDYFLYAAILEFVVKNFMGLNNVWGDLDLLFWGNQGESTQHYGTIRGFLYGSCLFNKEPSIHAFSLFIVSLIKLANNIANNKNRIIDKSIILCYALMFLSTSFSSVVFSISFIAIYLIYKWGMLHSSTLKFEFLVFGSIVGFVLIILIFLLVRNANSDNFILQRLQSLIGKTNDYLSFDIHYEYVEGREDVSSVVRFISVMQTLKAFLARPLFGYSLYAIWSHGVSATFIASVGICGFICWIRFYFYQIPLKHMIKPQQTLFLLGIAVYIICLFFSSGNGTLRPYSQLMPLVFIICNCFIFTKKR